MKQPLPGKSLLFCLFFFIFSHSSFSQSNTCAGVVSAVPTTSTCTSGINLLTSQTIFGSTSDNATVTGNACGAANTNADVWYKFVTQTEFPVITVTPTGSSWTTLLRAQILSGTCASFTERACGSNSASSGSPVTVIPSAALTPGTTYYVRVSKGSAGNPTGSAAVWNFDICIKEGAASRMGEVFKQTILSAASVLNYPWEITYGPDNYLWVTESKGYKVYRMDPNTGAKTTVLDISQFSTFFTAPADIAYNCQFANGSGAQGGLAGLALHPNFLDGTPSEKNYVYISYIRSMTSASVFTNSLVRFTYNPGTGKFETPVTICDTLPGSNDHNSQRIIIAPVTIGGPKYLFYASGDMGAGQGSNFNQARTNKSQFPNSYEGKILRFELNPVGSGTAFDKWIPDSNPYNTMLGVQSAVWAIGIRNNQGFAYDTTANILYGSSHGPYSDDEINILEGFRNFGHPIVIGYYSDGNYDGNTNPGTAGNNLNISAGAPYSNSAAGFGNSSCLPIGSEATRKTQIDASGNGLYKDPLFSAYPGIMPVTTPGSVRDIWQTTTGTNGLWPSEAWSGLDLYTNKVIPGWKQSLVAAGLKWGRVLRLKLDPSGTITLPSNNPINNAGDTITYLQSINRYRDLAFGPNGKDIYLIMDNSSATSGPGTNNPVAPACPGCVLKYSFLGYVDNAGLSTIPKIIDVTDGTVNTCNTGTTVTIDATNNNLWVPITGPDGNIMAEIKANGNNLGLVTSSFYKNSGGIRNKGGVRYLDRNITIIPTTQPASTVNIRLYISKTEFDALDADASSGLTGTGNIGLLKILKNTDPCRATALGITTTITPTNTLLADLTHGTNGYVLQGNISSFSSFYFGTSNILLPLDLLTFKGSLQNNKTTLLKWTTENEINTSHFEVERSLDGNTFNSIGSVAASGNSSSAVNYSFTDNNAAIQQSLLLYYRLKMIDQNGNFKYSNVITISLADITGKVVVAPNPVINEMKVTISSPQDGKMQWKLIDNTGRVIMQNSTHVRKGNGNNITINMNKLANGSYYLSVNGAGIDQKIKLQKL